MLALSKHGEQGVLFQLRPQSRVTQQVVVRCCPPTHRHHTHSQMAPWSPTNMQCYVSCNQGPAMLAPSCGTLWAIDARWEGASNSSAVNGPEVGNMWIEVMETSKQQVGAVLLVVPPARKLAALASPALVWRVEWGRRRCDPDVADSKTEWNQ
jgi:hypothetical protein